MRCPRCKMPTFMKLGGNSAGCGTCGYYTKNLNPNRNKTCGSCKNHNCSYVGTGYNACPRYMN